MTEKQRLLNILSQCGDDVSVESVIYRFLQEMGESFSALRLNRWISDLNNILYDKQLEYERMARVSLERATYLKNYLDGKLYKDEETARKYVDIQKAHAQAIIDVCKGAKDNKLFVCPDQPEEIEAKATDLENTEIAKSFEQELKEHNQAKYDWWQKGNENER